MTNGEYNPTTPRDQYGNGSQLGRISDDTPSGTQVESQPPVSEGGNGGSSTPEISADIERTRRQVGQRIDQIQAKLDPDRLISDAQEAVREVISDTASSITDYVRENRVNITSAITRAARRNPLPTALVGLGVGWLLLESLGGDSDSGRRQQKWEQNREQNTESDFEARSTGIYGSRSSQSVYRDARGNIYDPTEGHYRERSSAQESDSNPLSKIKDTVSHVTETVKDQVEGVVQNVQQQVGEMGDRVGDQWSSTGDRVQEIGGSMRRTTRKGGRQLQRSLEDNPLTYGALALAAGAVVAYILPQTQMENQAVGRYRDQIVDDAGAVVHEAAQRAQEVVDEVRPELERSAQAIGQELTQSAKQAGERIQAEITPVIEKAKEAVKDETRQAAADHEVSQGSQS